MTYLLKYFFDMKKHSDFDDLLQIVSKRLDIMIDGKSKYTPWDMKSMIGCV